MFKLIDLVEARDGIHKYKVILMNKETGRQKTVKFGRKGYMDYTLYNQKGSKKEADKHKLNYLKRHSKMGEDWSATGSDSAGFYARWILWNLPTLKESLEDTIKRFNL
jgi:hypothetical protein